MEDLLAADGIAVVVAGAVVATVEAVAEPVAVAPVGESAVTVEASMQKALFSSLSLEHPLRPRFECRLVVWN